MERDENLAMIADSVAFLVANGKRVVFDAEHFFDGYRLDREYALQCVSAAAQAGADTVAEDWQAPAATGSQWLAVAKSAATGAGTCLAAILA